MPSHEISAEGIDAVAGALGMERRPPPGTVGSSEEELAEGLRRIVGG